MASESSLDLYDLLFKQNKNVFMHGAGGVGKCLGRGTPIIKYDGTIVNVENIKEGDLLMGDDNTPRTVQNISRGRDTMYKIKQNKGDDYIVNSVHILSLKTSIEFLQSWNKKEQRYILVWFENIDRKQKSFTVQQQYRQRKHKANFSSKEEAYTALLKYKQTLLENNICNRYGSVHDIPLNEYIKKKFDWRETFVGFKADKITCWGKKIVDIDPYMVGYWLGDGTSSVPEITSQDSTILKYFAQNLADLKMYLQFESGYKYRINGINAKRNNHSNFFMNMLKKYNLLNNKHIPPEYKYNDEQTRLELLAGYLDADGYLDQQHNNVFDFLSKSKQLFDDITFLARSLGFASYGGECQKGCMYKGEYKEGTYYRGTIYGEGIENIPTKILRKKSEPYRHNKNHLVTQFTVEKLEEDDYFGFELDADRRFLLGDFTVTHNTFSINQLKEECDQRDIDIAITSTTGVSSIPIRGTTIHRWSGIRLGDKPIEQTIKYMKNYNKDAIERWKDCQVLVIDEMSMLSATVLDLLNGIAKRLRKSSLPFGGIKLLLSGDLFQLPPVNGQYPFFACCWKSLKFETINMTTPYRYPDVSYFELLQRVRIGEHTDDDIKLLQTRVDAYKVYKAGHMVFLDEFFGKDVGNYIYQYIYEPPDEQIIPTHIFSKKIKVEEFNNECLDKLTSEEKFYRSTDKFTLSQKVLKRVETHGIVEPDLTDGLERSFKLFLDNVVPPVIKLKKSAQVMLTINMDPKSGLVNGSRGVVMQCNIDTVSVKFVGGDIIEIPRHSHVFEDGDWILSRKQFPLMLAFGISFHKIQSRTLDMAVIDMSELFAAGQGYVGLSRVRTLQGLYIISMVPKSIYCDWRVMDFVSKA